MDERPLGDGPAEGEHEATAKEKERVRLIGSEEAAEALERGDVAPRRGQGTPRYGDRPDAPPDDAPRPTLRFPLARDAADSTEVPRPRPTAPTPLPTPGGGRGGDRAVDETEVRPTAATADPTDAGAAADTASAHATGSAPSGPGEPPAAVVTSGPSAAAGAEPDEHAPPEGEAVVAPGAPPAGAHEPPPQAEVEPPVDDVAPTVAEPAHGATSVSAGADLDPDTEEPVSAPPADASTEEAPPADDHLRAWSSLGISGARWRGWDQDDEDDAAAEDAAGAVRPLEPRRPAPSGFFREPMADEPAVTEPPAPPPETGGQAADEEAVEEQAADEQADAAVVRPDAWGRRPDDVESEAVAEEDEAGEGGSTVEVTPPGPEGAELADAPAPPATDQRPPDGRHLRPLDDGVPLDDDVDDDRGPEPAPAGAPAPARDVRLAVLSGVGLAAVALALFLMGPGAAMVLVGVVILVATAELFSALQRGGYQPATLLGLVSSAGLAAGTYWRGEAALPIVFGLTVIVALLWYLVGVTRLEPTMNAGVTILASAYVGLLGSFAALMLREPSGRGLLGGVIIAVVANDVGALVTGRRLGRRLIAPHISPNKTLEGLLGGAVASVVLSAVLLGSDLGPFGMAPWSLGTAAALGLLVAVVAPMGDLSESLLKRDLGIKDMSTIIPGHGGLLDRVDALLFCLPAVYYLARLLEIG